MICLYKIELLFFHNWGEQVPLTIHETDNSRGFLQVGALSIRKERPALGLVVGSDQWELQSGEQVLWRGGQLPETGGGAAFEKDPFEEVLYQGDEQVVLMASGNHIRVLEGGSVVKELHERGAGRTQEGIAFLGTYAEGRLQVRFSEGEAQILEVGSEVAGNGPWVIRSADGPEWLVSNHKQLRYYRPDGTLIREETLSNENYSEVLFPRDSRVMQTVAESPNSFLIAFSGPEGYGILQVSD